MSLKEQDVQKRMQKMQSNPKVGNSSEMIKRYSDFLEDALKRDLDWEIAESELFSPFVYDIA